LLFGLGCNEIQDIIDESLAPESDSKPTPSHEITTADPPAPTSETSAPGKIVSTIRPWENINCEVTPLPEPPGSAGAVTGWTQMDYLSDDGAVNNGHVLRGYGNDLFAIGSRGSLLRSDENGAAWTRVETGTDADLNDMFIGPWPAYIVGSTGTILTYSPVTGTVKKFETPFEDWAEDQRPDLVAVWGDNSEDFYILGDGTFYHYSPLPSSDPQWDPNNQGPQWKSLTAPTSPSIISTPDSPTVRDVWVASSRNVFALLSNNTVSYWNGSEWTNTKLPTNALVRGIWGLASDDIFAVGAGGLILHYDGVEWSEFNNIGLSLFNSYTDIWGTSHSNLFIVGDPDPTTDSVFHFDGATWNGMSAPTANNLQSIWGFSSSLASIYIAGLQGDILRYVVTTAVSDGELHWFKHNASSSQYSADLLASTSDVNTIYFAGYSNTGAIIVRNDPFEIWDVSQPGVSSLEDIVIKNDKIYAVGKLNGEQGGLSVLTRDLTTGQQDQFQAVEADALIFPTDIVVGDDGAIYVAGQTSGPIGDQPHAGFIEEDPGNLNYTPYAFDAFVMKLSPNGDRQWVRVFGNPDTIRMPLSNRNGERVSGLAINANGDLLVAGTVETPEIISSFADENGTQGFSLENIGQQQEIANSYIYLMRFSVDGKFIEGRGWGTSNYDWLSDMEQTNSGNIYLVGTSDYGGQIDAQQGNGRTNILILKLDSQWSNLWTRFIRGGGRQWINDATIASDGGIFVTGSTGAPIGGRKFSDGTDAFVAQIAANGVLHGTLLLGGVQYDTGMEIVTDSKGYPVVWAKIPSPSVSGFDPDAPGVIWDVGEIPFDAYSECRWR
jgi:hypothetical protein